MEDNQTKAPNTVESAGFYRTEEPEAQLAPPTHAETIVWTASEFIAQQKSAMWYVTLGSAALVVAIITYLLTKDAIATSVIIIAGIIMGIYGARQPRQLQYSLDSTGLRIGDRHLSLNLFRSFAVVDEGAISSIIFMPIKRFGQAITVYFDPNDEDSIINLLAIQLPMENKTHDSIDRLMRRIRF